MVSKKRAASASGEGRSSGDIDGFGNPRFDEILTLVSRSLLDVIDSTFESTVDEDDLTDELREKGIQAGDRLVAPASEAQWQVELFEVGRNGRGDVVESSVGHADLVVKLKWRDLDQMSWSPGFGERKLMILCRPQLRSAADALRTLKGMKSRRNEVYGRDEGNPDEIWAVATDNDQMRDIFEANGFRYICTRWNDIDGWGRTDGEEIKKVVSQSGGQEQWVLVETDIGGVSTTVIANNRADAVAWLANSAQMFIHAYPGWEFRVCGEDMDGALSGLRLLMKMPTEDKDGPWLVPVQLCKGMGMQIEGEMSSAARSLAEGGFEMAGAELTRLVRSEIESLDPAEVERLKHSWAALMFGRHDLPAAMAERAGKAAKGKKSASAEAQALRDDLRRVTVWKTTTAMVQGGDED